eukprot:scaffold36544_cov19-Tisochrysis_lutea.AAC.5
MMAGCVLAQAGRPVHKLCVLAPPALLLAVTAERSSVLECAHVQVPQGLMACMHVNGHACLRAHPSLAGRLQARADQGGQDVCGGRPEFQARLGDERTHGAQSG